MTKPSAVQIAGWAEYSAARNVYINAAYAYDAARDRGGYPVKESRAANEANARLVALAATYPAAAAYALALSFCEAANNLKATAGTKAVANIEAGADPIETVKQMQAEWSAAAMHSIMNS